MAPYQKRNLILRDSIELVFNGVMDTQIFILVEKMQQANKRKDDRRSK